MTIEEFIERLEDLKININAEIDRYMTDMVTNLYNIVKARTFTAHIDSEGVKFKSYTDKYAKWKAKKYPSKFMGIDERNFELTGDMKANFKMFQQKQFVYMIGWLDSELEDLAAYNSKNAGVHNIILPTHSEIANEVQKFNKKVYDLLDKVL